MTTFAYIDETIIDCRLKGIYNTFRKSMYPKMEKMIEDTYRECVKTPMVDMDMDLYSSILEYFRKMKQLSKQQNYDEVHNLVRDLHYKIYEYHLDLGF